MPRFTTFRQKIDRIKRRYKKVSPERFFYNTKHDLSGRYNRITCWFIIHDKDRGRSIFPIEFKRKLFMSVKEWKDFFLKPVGDYKPLFKIFTQDILPAINNRPPNPQWKFVSLLGWTGTDDLRQGKDSATHKPRDNTTKKRNANARSSNRRRHRNKKR